MESTLSGLVELLLCYSAGDESFYVELEKHVTSLTRSKLVHALQPMRIDPKENKALQGGAQLSAADIILLLISSDFLASDYVSRLEIDRTMERHRSGEVKVIPIKLKAADWTATPFEPFQPLPRNGKPVADWRSRDKAYEEIVREVRAAVEELHTRSAFGRSISRGSTLMFPSLGRNLRATLELEESVVSHLLRGAEAASLGRVTGESQSEIEFLRGNITKLRTDLRRLEADPSDSNHKLMSGEVYAHQNFIGREEEINRLLAVLSPSSSENVILIKGPSGAGKSALAKLVAQRAVQEQLFDRAVIVDMSAMGEFSARIDPIDKIFDVVKDQLDPDSLVSGTEAGKTRFAQLRLAFSKSRFLVIVDNLDGSTHLLSRVTDLMRDAIGSAGKVLITSTHHLSTADCIVNVGGMGYCEAALLMRREASMKDLRAVVYADPAILRRAWSWASGLPLAMEWLIGYSSTAAISFEVIIARLEQGEVQREEEALLKQLFRKSFDLFRADRVKRNVIYALSIFATHGTLESIAHVSGTRDKELEDALSYLYQLSLVHFDGFNEQYSLLPITKRFVTKLPGGTSKLTEFYERAVEYYSGILATLDEVQSQQPRTSEQLRKERQNILAVLDWCIAHDKWESFIGIGLKMNAVLGYEGQYPARLKYANELLRAAEQLEKLDLQAWILVHEVGWINQHLGDYDEADAATNRAISIATKLSDNHTLGLAKRNLGIIHYRRAVQEADPAGKNHLLEMAQNLIKEALELQQGDSESRWRSITLRSLALVAKERKDYASARGYLNEALPIHRLVQDWESEALTISDLGDLASLEGDFDAAKKLLTNALTLDEKHNRPFGKARNRWRLASVEVGSGNREEAAKLIEAALSIFEDMEATMAIKNLKADAAKWGIDLPQDSL